MKKPLSKILEEARVAYRDGKKLRAVMEADPNFRAYVDSGASTKVARLVSMSYIMASVFDEYTENAAGLSYFALTALQHRGQESAASSPEGGATSRSS